MSEDHTNWLRAQWGLSPPHPHARAIAQRIVSGFIFVFVLGIAIVFVAAWLMQ